MKPETADAAVKHHSRTRDPDTNRQTCRSLRTTSMSMMRTNLPFKLFADLSGLNSNTDTHSIILCNFSRTVSLMTRRVNTPNSGPGEEAAQLMTERLVEALRDRCYIEKS